jgi:hypothetical protein
MTNLPEQAHGTSVATTSAPEAYAIDQSMVKLPSLYLAQFSSKAFKARLVNFGDVYVGVGAEDPTPAIMGGVANDAKLSSPVRFYVHSVQPGYQVVDTDAAYGKRSLRLGTPYAQALREGGGDPRNVFLQTHMTLTIPDYPLYPVRFIMGSRWGGSSARWINTQIAMAIQQKQRPLDLAFQIQTRPTSNDSGDFVDAVVGFAKVAAKDAKADQEIVTAHAELLSSGQVDTSGDYSAAEAADTSEAPSLG